MFVHEFSNIARPATVSELYIHTNLRNIRIRNMKFLCTKKEVGGKAIVWELLACLWQKWEGWDERERARQRKRQREKWDRERIRKRMRITIPLGEILLPTDYCHTVIPNLLGLSQNILHMWERSCFIDTVNWLGFFVCFSFKFYIKFLFLYNHLAGKIITCISKEQMPL
jgi:hypothetical protein